jgi:hypothetical protein
MKILTGILLLGISLTLNAQDTIRMMQYNLLDYNLYNAYCTTTNNLMSDKDQDIKQIVKYVKPDIFTLCEMGANAANPQHLMDSALNVDGVNYYQRANFTNFSGSDLVNMLYYNSVKLSLLFQSVILTGIRDINMYKLYYNDPNLSTTHDTAFFICIIAHLKAGSAAADQTDRAATTSQIMNYIVSLNITGNIMIMGDFNVQASSETSFQNLIGYADTTKRFHDPINKLGNWNNNSSFAAYHTQSTSSAGDGCKASSGLDDRFDFILTTGSILYGTQKVHYVPGTYHAVGQDGNHYNLSVNGSPTNTSVPSNVLTALADNSDHLPVTMKLVVSQIGAGVQTLSNNIENLNVNNPVDDILYFSGRIKKPAKLNLQVFSLLGQLMIQKELTVNSEYFNDQISLDQLKNGLYFLVLSDENSQQITKKIIKQ